jgi:hypothetical protein
MPFGRTGVIEPPHGFLQQNASVQRIEKSLTFATGMADPEDKSAAPDSARRLKQILQKETVST